MDDKHVPEGTANAQSNETPFVLIGQIFLVATAIGIGTGSWWWGGGSLLGLGIALAIKPTACLLVMLLTLGWGIMGYEIGTSFDSDSARYILGSVSFLVGLVVNFYGLGSLHRDL